MASTSLIVTRNPSHISWSQLGWTISILMAACTGSGLLFKRLLLRRLKLWIRGVVVKNGSVRKIPLKAAVIQGISAVKSVSSAAMDVAQANKEIMKFYVEDNNQISNAVQALETHISELSQAIIAARNVVMEKSYKDHLHATKVQSNGNLQIPVELETGRKLFSNPTGSTESKDQLPDESQSRKPDHAPHSASYLEVLAILERGEKPPGILEINDKPPNPHRPPSVSRLQPRPKPWEIVKVQKSEKAAEQYTYSAVANKHKQLYGSYPDMTQGQSPMYISPYAGHKDQRPSATLRHRADIGIPLELTRSENASYINSGDQTVEQKETTASTTMRGPLLLSGMSLNGDSEVAPQRTNASIIR